MSAKAVNKSTMLCHSVIEWLDPRKQLVSAVLLTDFQEVQLVCKSWRTSVE